MAALCVAVGTDSGGASVIVPDPTCAQSLVLVDSATYATLAENPLMIPMDQAPVIAGGMVSLFLAAWGVKVAIRALMT